MYLLAAQFTLQFLSDILTLEKRVPRRAILVTGFRMDDAMKKRQPSIIAQMMMITDCYFLYCFVYVGCSRNTRKGFIECLPLQQG